MRCRTDNEKILRFGYAVGMKDCCRQAQRVAWIVIVTRHELGARRKYSVNFFLACSQTYAKPFIYWAESGGLLVDRINPALNCKELEIEST
jgi:hypothetical protein